MSPNRLAERYVLRGVIATGGMGEVHLATDQRLGRQVAVKVLAQRLTDSPEAVERFRREAMSAAGLSHPNIARVYDYGVDGASHFIVMEYLAGRSLDRLLRDRAPLPPQEAVGIASPVCAALAAAHSAGIVHRDIKPGNIMVTPDGTVKVTDFGIARALGAAPLTDTGTVMGTAAYLPPEVSRGGSAGPGSDLYSLGIVLFEMLTGRVPFSGDTPVTVAMRHLSEDVPPPSELVPGLPRGLDEVVARATSREPGDRYPSAEAMADGLRYGDTRPLPLSTRALTRPLPTVPSEAAPSVAVVSPRTTPTPRRQPRTQREPSDELGEPLPNRPVNHDARPGRSRVAWVLGSLVLVLVVALGASLFSGGIPGVTIAPPSANTPSATAPTTDQSTPTPQAARPGVVPEGLVGSDLASAEQAIKANGLDFKWRMVASDAPRNQVIKATPGPGETLRPADRVILVVSRGR